MKVHGTDYISGKGSVLIYDQTRDIRADEVEYRDREPIACRVVDFICSNVDRLPLPEELLAPPA